ncbi:hypothetical protein [Rhodococcus sp. X156]|uniref:hypothetical protein n=1 Tax=Rhodococcus sp. X156 TaxID=2499145 RepID=UPI000FD9C204|nr:hypothetical protein [Rhodococcus sp. X156]
MGRLMNGHERQPALVGGQSYVDAATGCRFTALTPDGAPDTWQEYLAGAVDNYRKFGVQSAIDLDSVRDGRSTSMFFAITSPAGELAGGVRVQGPYTSPAQSHALTEWAGQPGYQQIHEMVASRLPEGVIELKTAWVSDRVASRSALTAALSRTVIHALGLLDVRHAHATAAGYVLDRWSTCGGVIADDVPAVPYPDDRYETKLMWFDRLTYGELAKQDQVVHILRESAALAEQGGVGRRYAAAHGRGATQL